MTYMTYNMYMKRPSLLQRLPQSKTSVVANKSFAYVSKEIRFSRTAGQQKKVVVRNKLPKVPLHIQKSKFYITVILFTFN